MAAGLCPRTLCTNTAPSPQIPGSVSQTTTLPRSSPVTRTVAGALKHEALAHSPPAPAIVQPPRGITANPAALARFPAHDRRVLEARDLWDAVDAGHGQDDSEPPPPFRGSLTDWEDAKYLKLLIRYGQPLKANPPAMKEFLEEFGYRAKASVTAHVNAFNVGAYKAWRAANGGRWAGSAWVKN